MNRQSAIEALEARIAPAVAIVNQPFDIIAGIGQDGAKINLGKMFDSSASYRTLVEFTTNYIDPDTNLQAKIVIELFDDKAPVTVANFLSYVTGLNGVDYDGTFFHRIADFGSTSEAGIDIIQGGGFDVSNIFTHIPTTSTVHNEYNANDPEVQNVRGTIAMAKTAAGPNTGSSEWFFNLNNNSSILDGRNNGGFTVFGVIKEGLNVIDAIGAANKINQGGALGELPVQDNYTKGKPKADQLFQIVSAEVKPSLTPNLNGHAIGDISIHVPGSNTTSDLFTKNFNKVTNELTLSYIEGKIGQAEVWVDVTKGDETVTEKFLVTVEPNLLSELTTHNLPATYIPGDQGVAKVKILNNLGGAANGNVKVQLYLSQVDADGDNALDADTFIVDSTDFLLGEAEFAVNIAPGESTSVSMPFRVKDFVDGIALINGKQYVVLSKVVPAEDSGISEVFSDDNDNALRTGHFYAKGFGDLGARKNAVMTIDTPTGEVSFKLTGKGSGTFTRDADGGIDVTLSGTNLGSTLTVKAITGSTGIVNIDDLMLSSVMGNVKLGNATLHGDFTAQAGVKNVIFGALGTENSGFDHSFSVNGLTGSAPKFTATFGNVYDYSLTSNVPVGRLSVTNWFDAAGTGENQIFAPQLDALRVTGDMEANLLLGTDARVAQIIVGGTLRNADLTVFGNIGTVKLGNMVGSTILAGMNTRPDDLTDFVLDRSIGSFTVTGTYSDSIVAASRINSVSLGNVDKTGGADLKGIYADAIKSYVRKGVDGIKLTKLDAPGTFDVDPNVADQDKRYEVRLF